MQEAKLGTKLNNPENGEKPEERTDETDISRKKLAAIMGMSISMYHETGKVNSRRWWLGKIRKRSLGSKIIDEPVSALEVSVRAQLMNLLMDLHQAFEITYIMVAHDLAVVIHMSNRIAGNVPG